MDKLHPNDLIWTAARTEKGGYALTITSGGLQATMLLRHVEAGIELVEGLSRFFVAELEEAAKTEDLGKALQAEAEAEAQGPE